MTENEQTPERVTVRIILKCGQCIQFECEDFTVYTDKELAFSRLTPQDSRFNDYRLQNRKAYTVSTGVAFLRFGYALPYHSF